MLSLIWASITGQRFSFLIQNLVRVTFNAVMLQIELKSSDQIS